MGGSEAAMAAVLHDDDLLREILLRLGFPAFLVCAALVSKRWLGLAADPAFLCRFRDRHPPHLLGLYVHNAHSMRPQFVPVSEAPELRSTVIRAGFDEGDPAVGIFDCRNGRLLLQNRDSTNGEYFVSSPLCPMRSVVPVLPPPPQLPGVPEILELCSRCACFLSRDSSADIVFAYLLLINGKLSVQVYLLQSGAWGEGILAQGQLPGLGDDVSMVMVAHGKLYMLAEADRRCIHRLDFVAQRPQFFTIKLPNEVGGYNYQLSSADDGGFFVIHGEGFQLSVWHHETDDNGEDNWELVDSYCVRAAHDRCEEILVLGVGDNAEFVFLGLQENRAIICVNLRTRNETVYEMKVGFMPYIRVFPFMTVWPPIFPALNDDNDHGDDLTLFVLPCSCSPLFRRKWLE